MPDMAWAVLVIFFPQPIPTGTAVPHWAYQNYLNSSSSTFNVTLAQQLSDNPESSAPSGPTSTSNSANAKGRSEGGAIAGGVVGGIAFLVISAILVFLFLRHRRRKAAASRDRPSIDDVTAFTAPTSHPTDPPSPPPMRLYNPSDPSTFPPSQDMIQNNNTESPFSPLSRHPLRNIHAPTQYTGVPEL
ncbi:hypothetical protein GYMLUDRAFT_235887 [Collybiopsis luxurians FD-317 M1]|nr:hypothetical protein GYMLUDRAFT_235887 [Collybiopsis luxurians FD-317 M1]